MVSITRNTRYYYRHSMKHCIFEDECRMSYGCTRRKSRSTVGQECNDNSSKHQP